MRAARNRYRIIYRIAKGDLKSGLKATMEGTLFDAAFAALGTEGAVEVRADRVREAGTPWEPPAATVAASPADAQAGGRGAVAGPADGAPLAPRRTPSSPR